MTSQMESPFDSKKKGQHYLKSADIKSELNSYDIGRLSEDESFEYFVTQRWGDRNNVICPGCGAISNHYFDNKKKRWRCKYLGCQRYFSVFTGTVFHDRKLTFHKILCFLTMFVSVPYGVSTSSAKSMLSIQCKTAQVLMGKIRELFIRVTDQTKLKGLVHMDGGYFGGKPRHGRIRRVENSQIKQYVESMLLTKTSTPKSTAISNARKRSKDRRVVMVLREVSPIKGIGATRTIVAIVDSETENYAMSLALKYVEQGATIMTDESPAYNQLSKYYHHETVMHAKEFATIDGVNSNQAESFFSRLRLNEYTITRRMEPKYLFDIALEMAWREDVRRLSYKQRLSQLLDMLFTNGQSIYWRGYWQGLYRTGELIWSIETGKPKLRSLPN